MALFEEGPSGLRPRGSFNVQVKFEGDWIKFSLLTKNLDSVIAIAAMNAQRQFAEKYRDRVKRNIREGGRRFGYPPNEGEYARRKSMHWGATRPLVVSNAMHDAVEVFANSKKTRYMVGIKEGQTRPDYWPSDSNQLQIHEYANIVEKGFSNSKAIVEGRPVFSDTFKAKEPHGMGGKAGLIKTIELGLAKAFATIGAKVTKRL